MVLLDNRETLENQYKFARSQLRELKPCPSRDCTRDFSHIRYEQYGLSYLDLWTLPALWSRSRAERIRMAFSNIDREGIKGMKGNRNVGTKDAFCGAKRV